MGSMRDHARPIVRKRSRHHARLAWPLLVIFLLGLNVYLFVLRGLPTATGGAEQHPPDPAPAALSARAPAGPSEERFESSLGEMQGVAGSRGELDPRPGDGAEAAGRADPPRLAAAAFGPVGTRFDLAKAKRVAGQRSMEQWCHQAAGDISQGDTFSTALSRQGMAAGQIFAIIEALKPVLNFRQCRQGERFEALIRPDGKLYRFVYLKSPEVSYVAERDDGRLVGRREKHQAEVTAVPVAVRIHGSLWQSLAGLEQRANLVAMIVDIFAWDIDFYVDTHPGDTIRLLIERHSVDGQFARWGRILAAEYSGDVGVHRAFWFDATGGRPEAEGTRGYFDEHGDSLRKAFLKSPLKFARISSSYGMRVHPVLGFNKMHNGIDFSAPIGTPVWAPADGTVLHAGWLGSCGKAIELRHANGYQTIFCHLSRIDRAVSKGKRVRQKQVIAKVGSTGRSTGPHLHYGMKLHGHYVNPLGQKFPPAKPVPKAELPTFTRAIAPLLESLEAIGLPNAGRTASAMPPREDAG